MTAAFSKGDLEKGHGKVLTVCSQVQREKPEGSEDAGWEY